MGGGQEEKRVFNGDGVSVGDEKALEMDGGDGCATL